MIAQPVMPDAPKTRAWRPVLDVLADELLILKARQLRLIGDEDRVGMIAGLFR